MNTLGDWAGLGKKSEEEILTVNTKPTAVSIVDVLVPVRNDYKWLKAELNMKQK
jgi:hypothetical protein